MPVATLSEDCLDLGTTFSYTIPSEIEESFYYRDNFEDLLFPIDPEDCIIPSGIYYIDF